MADAQAKVNHKRRMSTVWIVPIVALVMGIWMVIYTIQSQGAEF